MGCDIHLHIEIKLNGKWEHYAAPDVWRDYRLFEKMAGVRGEVENAIAPPRGMPLDASVVTRFCCDDYGVDGHSHSWLNAQEIAELSNWGEDNLKPCGSHYRTGWDMEWAFGCYLLGNSFAGFVKYPNERPVGLEDIRFVFWFDN